MKIVRQNPITLRPAKIVVKKSIRKVRRATKKTR